MPSLPSLSNAAESQQKFHDHLNLSILGIGVAYPPHRHGPESLRILADRFYKPSTALTKVLTINRFTGIEQRASIGNVDHPIANQPTAPTIKELNELFQKDGVKISVEACRQAIQEWGGAAGDITHMVSSTCTNSANPGYDHFVRKQLGVRSTSENILLHGIGCSGGLAALRTACNLALGASYQGKPARILVLACEISTPLFRSELDSVDRDQQVRIGVCLFSDGASACIVSNNIGPEHQAAHPFEILGWKHDIIQDTEDDLGFDVDPSGWKVVLTPRVPDLTRKVVAPAFDDLVQSVPGLSVSGNWPVAAEFDWALHPGGSTIIENVQKSMNLSPEHLQASWEIYMGYGNSSSATILSVMNRLRSTHGRDKVVACAFGPGISLEMMVLRRAEPANEKSNGLINGINGAGSSTVQTNGVPTELASSVRDHDSLASNMESNGVSDGLGVPMEDVD